MAKPPFDKYPNDGLAICQLWGFAFIHSRKSTNRRREDITSNACRVLPVTLRPSVECAREIRSMASLNQPEKGQLVNDYPSPKYVKQTVHSIIAQHDRLTEAGYPLSVWQTHKLQGAVTAFWSGMMVLANCEVRNAEATNLAEASDYDAAGALEAISLNDQIEHLRKYEASIGANERP